jgi:cell division protein FtsI/penicillin-binding protein 2
MLRRHAIATLLAAGASAKRMDSFFADAHGAAVLVDRNSRRLLAAHTPELAAASPAPPGSTLKPLVLNALLERGRLEPGDTFPCAGDLRLEGRSFACAHPPLPAPVNVRTAIAYSCNCYVAHFASRFASGELAGLIGRWGLVSRTNWFGEREAPGRTWNAPPGIQSLGEDGVLVTPASLALAYCRLISRAHPAVLAGMTGAVEFGTAQRARVAGLNICGKTGSVRTPEGAALAWFVGFSDTALVTVLLQARSGGSDAAPIGGRILEAHAKGLL